MYHDLTLRDGSHAIRHRLTLPMIEKYCKFAEDAGIHVIEVGHGNGLGASSLTIGESLHSDIEMIRVARTHLKNTKLSVHIISGFATLTKDIIPAMSAGVDIFRVASHCKEASLTKSHIEYLCQHDKYVIGVLMMAALCSRHELLEQATLMKSWGAKAIVIMDSTGSMMPRDVHKRISTLMDLEIPVGFHGHNNLQLAVANSMAAMDAGASIIDVTIHGFGAGAGNTPLEIMETIRPSGSVNIDTVMQFCEESPFHAPSFKPMHVLTAWYRIFSGFDVHIRDKAWKYSVSIAALIKKLAENGVVAGQEDLIEVAAQSL